MKNAILFSNVDREDFWVNGIVFKVENTNTYEESYEEIKSKLEAPEIIENLIDDHCLMFDLFHNDASFKFVRTYWNRGLYFVFSNGTEEVEYRMSADYVTFN